MKANIYFDGEKYKFYYGDAQIVTDSLTINEVAIDSELSNTSKNAVQNRLIKGELDKHAQRFKEVNERINGIINNGITVMAGDDFKWTWYTSVGITQDITLLANTIVYAILPAGISDAKIIKSNGDIDDYVLTWGEPSSTQEQVGVFSTGNVVTGDTFRVNLQVEESQKATVEQNFKFLVVSYPNELKDIRVDYFGITHSSAGDAVRSILNVIQNGNLSLVDSLKWIGKSTTLFKFMFSSDEIAITKDQTIQVVLPPLTALQITNISAEPQESQQIGDITATSQQDLNVTLNAGNTYYFSIVSNNEEFNMYMVSIYIELDAKMYEILVDKVTNAMDSALESIATAQDNGINALNDVTNTNIGNLNTITNNGINALNSTKDNLNVALNATKDTAVAQIEEKKNTSIADVTNAGNTQVYALTKLNNNLSSNMNTNANNHIQNIDKEAGKKLAEINGIECADWKLITEVEVTEDIGAVEVTTDSEGNPFAYDDIYIVATNVTSATGGNWSVSFKTTTDSSNSNVISIINANSINSTAKHLFSKITKMLGIGLFEAVMDYKTASAYTITSNKYVIAPKYDTDDSTKVNWIRIHFSATNTINAGTIKIFGRNRR